jgi:hypothetical protein
MKPASAYGYVLANDVFAVLLGLPKRQQHRLAAEFERLASHPTVGGATLRRTRRGTPSDFTSTAVGGSAAGPIMRCMKCASCSSSSPEISRFREGFLRRVRIPL